MKLNIYKKGKIDKTYTADTYDFMFGTLEDIAAAIDFDALQTGSDVEIIKMVGKVFLKSRETITDLMKDIFDGLTDAELKYAKVTEMARVIVEVVQYTIAQLSKGTTPKN